MFECADSTLLAIWEKEPKEWTSGSSTETLAMWAASQAYGLTKALKKLHNFESYRSADDTDIKTHGIHGDLKPDNILYYKNWRGVNDDIGVLQITDFGLSSFHQTQSAEDIVLRRGTSTYRPPEAAILSPLSASFDTWSLGCLFLEFLTWLVRGPEGLQSFREKRLRSPGFASCHPCFWEVKEEDECTIVSLSSVVQEVSRISFEFTPHDNWN
jgi:serine/threonine protein kinase